MKLAQAWDLVEARLREGFSGLPIDADDNDDVATLPAAGVVRITCRSGGRRQAHTSGMDIARPMFVIQIYGPRSAGNRPAQDWAEAIAGLFNRSELVADDGSSGMLRCTATAVDVIGAVKGGRGFYLVETSLLFDNLTPI
jgi:hypothetical protein